MSFICVEKTNLQRRSCQRRSIELPVRLTKSVFCLRLAVSCEENVQNPFVEQQGPNGDFCYQPLSLCFTDLIKIRTSQVAPAAVGPHIAIPGSRTAGLARANNTGTKTAREKSILALEKDRIDKQKRNVCFRGRKRNEWDGCRNDGKPADASPYLPIAAPRSTPSRPIEKLYRYLGCSGG